MQHSPIVHQAYSTTTFGIECKLGRQKKRLKVAIITLYYNRVSGWKKPKVNPTHKNLFLELKLYNWSRPRRSQCCVLLYAHLMPCISHFFIVNRQVCTGGRRRSKSRPNGALTMELDNLERGGGASYSKILQGTIGRKSHLLCILISSIHVDAQKHNVVDVP